MRFSSRIIAASFGVLALCTSQPALALYNPTHDRWLNRDPVGESETVNQYCFDSP